MEDNKKGKILVISPTESFLAKGLVSKINAERLDAVLLTGQIKEIDPLRDETELIIIFMNEYGSPILATGGPKRRRRPASR